jgi:hypothetical protein
LNRMMANKRINLINKLFNGCHYECITRVDSKMILHNSLLADQEPAAELLPFS